MPSPFPGMDPYLEGSLWTSVHTELSSEIARQLAPKLGPKYVALPTRRFVTETPEDVAVTINSMYPDAGVVGSSAPGAPPESGVVVVPAPLRLATVMPSRVPLITIEIRDVANRQLVTAIEVLSPTNKCGEGYKEYLDKRTRLLYSTAHLVEIDLLRTGQRVPTQQPLPPAPYFVFVSRAEQRPFMEVWPIQLQMRLPIVPVPLLAEDPDTTFDLQLALNSGYDALRYDLLIDYTRQPEVPLEGASADWTAKHLRAAGFAGAI